jgi:hypothetical protein
MQRLDQIAESSVHGPIPNDVFDEAMIPARPRERIATGAGPATRDRAGDQATGPASAGRRPSLDKAEVKPFEPSITKSSRHREQAASCPGVDRAR